MDSSQKENENCGNCNGIIYGKIQENAIDEVHYYYPHCKHFGICANYNEASRMLMCSEDGYENPDECPIYIRVVKYKNVTKCLTDVDE